jgi:hypothetical protein
MSSNIVRMINAAGTAVSNTTTETSMATWTVAANELQPNKLYRISGSIRSTATNSTDTLVVTIRWGSSATMSSNTSVFATAAVDQVNDDVACFAIDLAVQSTTRAVVSGFISDSDAEGSKLLGSVYQILTVAKDTAYRLDITATWSVANAGNSCQAESFQVVELT